MTGDRRVLGVGGASRGVRESLSKAAAAGWPLLQVTLAATVAWAIALRIAGHADPFFAPVAAVVALSGPRGERGSQAVRLLLGVALGIVAGEIIVAVLSGGYGRLALACFAAMAFARTLGAPRVVIVQAGVSAILTVVAADGEAGAHRLVDAAIGGGVAMLFSQVLFSPEPVALLRRAEAVALSRIARGLDVTAAALESGDERLADRALASLRGARDDLGELARIRAVSGNVALHSAVWRSQLTPLVRERENADHLDLLGGACVLLARTVFFMPPAARRLLAPRVREIADVLVELARQPGDREARQRAVDRTLKGVRPLEETAEAAEAPDSLLLTVMALLRIVATDIMVFAGVDHDQALAAVRSGFGDFDVPTPPATPRLPFNLDRWDRRQSERHSASELTRRKSDRTDIEREE